jgi:hypothetical protein
VGGCCCPSSSTSSPAPSSSSPGSGSMAWFGLCVYVCVHKLCEYEPLGRSTKQVQPPTPPKRAMVNSPPLVVFLNLCANQATYTLLWCLQSSSTWFWPFYAETGARNTPTNRPLLTSSPLALSILKTPLHEKKAKSNKKT